MEWEETGWRCGIKYLGFNEEATVSEVIFRVMKGQVNKDMSPEENALYETEIEKVPTSLVYLGISWSCNFKCNAEDQCISL